MAENRFRLGIDIGGTFTDLVLLDQNNGNIISKKTPTVTEDPTQGITNGLHALKEMGISTEDIEYFVHGTTIGLNTIIQRNGAKVAFLVTEGFRDMLSFQRLRLPVPYDFRSRHPEPLVPRDSVFTVKERLQHDGTVVRPLDMDELERKMDAIKKADVDGVVICFLHSYINPVHELQVKEKMAEQLPNVKVNLSSELWPQMREYERSMMTILNMYVQPKVEHHFKHLKQRLEAEAVPAHPYITQSNGGIMDIDTASKQPVRTLFSGPAAGVIGALDMVKKAGFDNVITFDVGGTSADISIIENRYPTYTQSNHLGGFPVMLPSVSMYSVGAGGGSYAWIDNGGMLKVGPDSVGSTPGPACYGVGDKPALTDAFLVCGYLNTESFAGGGFALDVERSKQAIQPIADYLELTIQETADRMIQVAIANMFAEVNNIMEHHGFDPREFALLGYGGAGPVLSNLLAEEIQVNEVLIPPLPGTLSALGALNADFIHDEIKTEQVLLENMPMDELHSKFEQLAQQALNWLESQEGTDLDDQELLYTIDARYQHQAYEIELPIQPEWLDKGKKDEIIHQFHQLHFNQYGHSDTDASIELMNLHVRIVGQPPKVTSPIVEQSDAQPVSKINRDIMLKGNIYEAPVYNRSELMYGQDVEGPAIIEQNDTTVVLLNEWKAKVNRYGHLILSREKGGQ
ncbi:hydantoinase/oxoprolinase family protein [Gracilibacillus sp. YIM 98692]|uniref:hydantoinase/oxoprolinase family protein n=1 Tax=Gracilibacillus sp. YIM 98692 TaxID=2663532 RepID=UPI0013D1B2F7|nr:hydantoinase/oxoprolinase family protein [Gracilibacillus sp. YIM 98692]